MSSESLLPEDLSLYYKRLFPAALMVQWLGYARRPGGYFANREFSVTLPDDVYLRFLSFSDEAEFRSALMEKRPEKIDIGAVYNCRPRDRATVAAGAFQAKEKELVLDIDLTDYDGVRLCCSEARVCAKCWLFMRIAVKVLDRALRCDFGFQRLLWVYSGRRGIHCWVCDRTARQLSPGARSAVVEYLSLVARRKPADRQPLQQQQQVQQFKCHPSVSAAADIIRKHFPELVEQQGMFGNASRCRDLLDQLPEDIRVAVGPSIAKWEENPQFATSLKRWSSLSGSLRQTGHQSVEQDLLIHYAYPRLDVGVTTGLNHLLKAPFCVHPKTGRICVPFDPHAVDSFDPEAVPTLPQLLAELDKHQQQQQPQHHLMPYKVTSLRESVELFAGFVDSVVKDEAAFLQREPSGSALQDATNIGMEIM